MRNIFVCIILLALGCVGAYADDTTILWSGNSGRENPTSSRIPALVKTADGVLLAFSDVRHNRMDIGYGNSHIDIQMRRSTDNGKSWSAPVTVADGTGVGGAYDCGYGDASVVADNGGSGKVMMMCAAGSVSFPNSTYDKPIHISRFVSNDNGLTWSAGEDITHYIYNSVLDKPARVFFSSGKMTQSATYRKPGASFNRVYASLVTDRGSIVVYSDDFGETWSVLGNAVGQASGDEAHVVELPNGDVLLAGRAGFTATNRYVNLFTYTDKAKGEGTWGAQGRYNGTIGAGCHGDIDLLCATRDGVATYLLIQSAPTTNAPRRYVTFYYKEVAASDTYTLEDFTSGWSKGLQVYDDASAYSSLCHLGGDSEAILYERGERNYTAGAYNSDDPNPAGYDITFETFSIPQITENVFDGSSVHEVK